MTEETTEKKRGRPKGNAMVSIHLRVPAIMLAYYKGLENSSRAMREALREYMQSEK